MPLVSVATQIRSAVHLSEIPAEYRHLPVVGRGTTSCVLQEDADHVLVFTKDAAKVVWLTHPLGLRVGKVVSEFRANTHRKVAVRDLPITVVRVPIFHKLPAAKQRQVREFLDQLYDDFYTQPAQWEKPGHPSLPSSVTQRIAAWQMAQTVRTKYHNWPWWKQFYKLFLFLSQNTEWELDLHTANIMQTSTGDLVVIDPVLSTTMHTFIYGAPSP